MNQRFKHTTIIALPLLLSACCSSGPKAPKPDTQPPTYSSTVSTTAKVYSATNPQTIQFYQGQSLHKPYEVIGHIAVNRYNAAGEKRQLGVMSDVMKHNAAMLGGEGLINLHVTPLKEIADVIRFNDNTDETTLSPYYTF